MKRTMLMGLSRQGIEQLLAPLGLPGYRAEQIYKWVHHHQVGSFSEMTNLPQSLRDWLEENAAMRSLRLAQKQISSDGTRKYLWNLDSGRQVESVFIPEESRTTICISSQVGCALGCAFCATARMGFSQNLSAGEIVEQVIAVQEDTGAKISNVVFMGMGEPFLNYSRVIEASKILCDPSGPAISAKKITISTVGIVPRIHQFAEEKQPFSLAISLHAPTQELRRSIMPIAEKFPLDALIAAARKYTNSRSRQRVTYEYVLLAGVNDSPAEARELIRLLSTHRCKLNLIPYNDTGLGFRTPSPEWAERFLALLQAAPFTVTLRRNRGNDIAAACGQLFSRPESSQKCRSIRGAGLPDKSPA